MMIEIDFAISAILGIVFVGVWIGKMRNKLDNVDKCWKPIELKKEEMLVTNIEIEMKRQLDLLNLYCETSGEKRHNKRMSIILWGIAGINLELWISAFLTIYDEYREIPVCFSIVSLIMFIVLTFAAYAGDEEARKMWKIINVSLLLLGIIIWIFAR